jgi:hypothetical protein
MRVYASFLRALGVSQILVFSAARVVPQMDAGGNGSFYDTIPVNFIMYAEIASGAPRKLATELCLDAEELVAAVLAACCAKAP